MIQYILLRRAYNTTGTLVLSVHNSQGTTDGARTAAIAQYVAQLNSDRAVAFAAGEACEAQATPEGVSSLFFVQSVG